MRLRPIEERDLERVRELRNRDRHRFFTTHEISVGDHRRWFESLASMQSTFYVIELDEVVVGTISVTERPDGREIGNLVLDEAYRGRGLMTAAVLELCSAPGRFFALVKPDNVDSLRVFERSGFTPVSVRVERSV